MSFKIVRNDLVNMEVDAIVNSANPNPTYGAGCDYAIYEVAGKEDLLKERQKVGYMNVTDVCMTPAFKLASNYIIHVVSPIYEDGKHHEKEQLIKCYKNCLEVASNHKLHSIAFPVLSSGNYGYPKEEAIKIALACIQEFLFTHEMDIYLVVYDNESVSFTSKVFPDIPEYINEHYVYAKKQMQYNAVRSRRETPRRRNVKERIQDVFIDHESVVGSIEPIPVFDVKKEKTFQQTLFEIIDDKGLGDVEVYKKANIDRKLFSKIRCNIDYKPKKKTVFALLLALELNYEEAVDLLSRAGYAFSPSSLFDVIVEYCIKTEYYDIYTINVALFEQTGETL